MLCRLILGGQLRKKWSGGRARTWRMAILAAEVEIKLGPFVVIWSLQRRHSCSFQPSFISFPRVSGDLQHRNGYGSEPRNLGKLISLRENVMGHGGRSADF